MHIVRTTAWNTGCWYTAHGQRIGALLMNTGHLIFADIDRHIEGTLQPDFFPELTIVERVSMGYRAQLTDYWVADEECRSFYPHAKAVAADTKSLEGSCS